MDWLSVSRHATLKTWSTANNEIVHAIYMIHHAVISCLHLNHNVTQQAKPWKRAPVSHRKTKSVCQRWDKDFRSLSSLVSFLFHYFLFLSTPLYLLFIYFPVSDPSALLVQMVPFDYPLPHFFFFFLVSSSLFPWLLMGRSEKLRVGGFIQHLWRFFTVGKENKFLFNKK